MAANRGRVAAVRAVEAGLYPWQLQAPINREVLVPEVARQGLIVAGGLVANGSSAAGAFRLETGTGRLAAAGSLATATHDAAATVVDGQVLVFGGGTSAPAATTQDITASGSSHILGSLPRPRADADAVTIGGAAYVVGGYDGPSLSASRPTFVRHLRWTPSRGVTATASVVMDEHYVLFL